MIGFNINKENKKKQIRTAVVRNTEWIVGEAESGQNRTEMANVYIL